MKDVPIEVSAESVNSFLEKKEFRAPSLSAYRARASMHLNMTLEAVAEIDGKIEEVNGLLIRYQGKTDGKMVVMFLEGEGGYVRPVLSRYIKKEKVRPGEPIFRVERVKYDEKSRLKATLQRNTISLEGMPYSNDETVKVLIDVACHLIEERRDLLAGVELRNQQTKNTATKTEKFLSGMGEKIGYAKSRVQLDFGDPATALKLVEEFKRRKANDLKAAKNDAILRKIRAASGGVDG